MGGVPRMCFETYVLVGVENSYNSSLLPWSVIATTWSIIHLSLVRVDFSSDRSTMWFNQSTRAKYDR
jgi:hypothetical protein